MTTPLKVVQPITIGDAMLVATDVPEADHPAWSAATVYPREARVIRTATHMVYESLAEGNVGRVPESEPDWWVPVRPTNRWRLFDASASTATAQPNALSYTLMPGAFNAFALLRMGGVNSVRVRVTHPTLGTIYDRTVDVASVPGEPGWWQWFFGQRSAPSTVVLTDLPGIIGTSLLLDVAGTVDLAIGVLVIGSTREVGTGVLRGARLGIQDYSRRETNEFGDVVLVQRAYAQRITLTVPVLAQQVDATFDYLASLRAVPTLWIGSTRYGALALLGYYRDFGITLAYERVADCELQIEGMT